MGASNPIVGRMKPAQMTSRSEDAAVPDLSALRSSSWLAPSLVCTKKGPKMEHRIPEGDIGPDFGKHGKHLCKGPSKDGNVCANAGTDREAYCTYALGPALYPEEFPVDLHFCAYCADDN